MAKDDATAARLSGRCLCGAVRFQATPRGGMHACHCEKCRRMSGGVFLSVECVDVQATGPLKTYESSDWAVRQFCGDCGASLFWRMRDGSLDSVAVQAFDDPGAFSFDGEIYIDAKPGNYAFAGDRQRLTGAEVEAMFGMGQD